MFIDWENVIIYWEESEQSKTLASKCGWFQNQLGVWGAGSGTTPRKSCNFYPHLTLKTVFPALKLPQNCYMMNIESNFPTQHIYPA